MSAQLDLFSVYRPLKQCGWCEEWKELREFGRSRHEADGRQRTCKECLAANWRKNHQIDEAPPIPRRSAYDVIEDELDALEFVARNGGNVVAQIDHIRQVLKLDVVP